MKFLASFLYLVIPYFVLKVKASNETIEDSHVLNRSLPNFTWIDSLNIHVEFPDGSHDTIVLWKSEKIGDIDVACLYEGTMKVEASADVVVSGCRDDDLVSITIHSTRLFGQTMFYIRDGATEEIPNPYDNGELLEEDYEYDDEVIQRGKRSVFEDYVEEDYSDMGADGDVDPPPRLGLDIKLGFEESLKAHLGGETAAREYVVEVFTHARSYMKHSSLGTSLHLNAVGTPTFVPNKYWTARRDSVLDAKTVKVNEPIPILYFCYDNDDNVKMGLSMIRKACSPTDGVGILKYRKSVPLAANTLNHENGHLVGLQHDRKEDERDGGNADNPCDQQGFMSEMAPADRPAVFSECSRRRFKRWWNTDQASCLTEIKIPENLKMCPYPHPSLIAPCQCKLDAQYKTYLFCASLTQEMLDNLGTSFQCKKQVHRIEIDMLGKQLDSSFNMENIGALEIEYFYMYNVSKITTDFEANIFKGSSQTLKEIKIQRLSGEVSVGSTIKTDCFKDLTSLKLIQISGDFEILQSKSFSGLPLVVELKMRGAKTIERDAFFNMAALKKLDLANNVITTLNPNFVNNAPKLVTIDLSHNNITTLSSNILTNLPSLMTINLNNNKIMTIENNAMTNLPKLELLDLSENKIQDIKQTLHSVKNKDLKIKLNKNKLESLPAASFESFVRNIVSQNGAGYVDLESIELDCLCDVKWLYKQQQVAILSKFLNAICKEGHQLDEVDSSFLEHACPSDTCFGISTGKRYWSSAHDKIWGDGECPNLGNHNSGLSLEECKKKCLDTPSCTAINFRATTNCILRGCTYPVSAPQWLIRNYTGYSIQDEYEPVPIYTDASYKYYKLPVPASSKMMSALVLSTCTKHGMMAECHSESYADSNCEHASNKHSKHSYPADILTNKLCGTTDRNSLKSCAATLNMFWYMKGNWGSGSACGSTKDRYCSTGKDYTSTNDMQYFAACVKPL